MDQDKTTEALSAFNQSLALAAHSEGYVCRATARIETNELDAAIADCDEALRLDPRQWMAFTIRAICKQKLNDINGAITDYTIAISSGSADASTFFGRGMVWFNLDQYQLAIADLNQALRLEPQSANLYMMRGLCWLATDDAKRAIADFDHKVQLDPSASTTYYLRAIARESVNDLFGAKIDYEQALHLDPDDALFRNGLAFFLATCGDASLRDYGRAIALARDCCNCTNWRDYEHLAMLATAFSQAGNFAEAVKWQTESIRLAPFEERESLVERLTFYQTGKPYYNEYSKRGDRLHSRPRPAKVLENITVP